MITAKQHTLLIFIHSRLQETGVAPSFDEMRLAIGLKSKSGVDSLIRALEERGFLRRLPNKARAVEVIKLPENITINNSSEEHLKTTTNPDNNIISATFGQDNNISNSENKTNSIPKFGKVAAGIPIEAMNNPSDFIDVPVSMLGNAQYYALTIDGDSMIDAGILDGDTVVIENTQRADSGAIVVALIDQNEATLKKFYKRGNTIALEPANKLYETKIYSTERVAIQGKLVALMRDYN